MIASHKKKDEKVSLEYFFRHLRSNRSERQTKLKMLYCLVYGRPGGTPQWCSSNCKSIVPIIYGEGWKKVYFSIALPHLNRYMKKVFLNLEEPWFSVVDKDGEEIPLKKGDIDKRIGHRGRSGYYKPNFKTIYEFFLKQRGCEGTVDEAFIDKYIHNPLFRHYFLNPINVLVNITSGKTDLKLSEFGVFSEYMFFQTPTPCNLFLAVGFKIEKVNVHNFFKKYGTVLEQRAYRRSPEKTIALFKELRDGNVIGDFLKQMGYDTPTDFFELAEMWRKDKKEAGNTGII